MSRKAKKVSVIFVVLVALLAAVIVVSCSSSKDGSTNISSIPNSYSVDCKVVSITQKSTDGDDYPFPGVELNIKGPAKKLAVVLISPEGQSKIEIISEEQMIANSYTVRMITASSVLGKWSLAVKTLEPEKVVWQIEIPSGSPAAPST